MWSLSLNPDQRVQVRAAGERREQALRPAEQARAPRGAAGGARRGAGAAQRRQSAGTDELSCSPSRSWSGSESATMAGSVS